MKISSIVVQLVVCFAFVVVFAQAGGQQDGGQQPRRTPAGGAERKRKDKPSDPSLRGVARTGGEDKSCGPHFTIEKCYPMDMSGSCYHAKNACDIPAEFSCVRNGAFNAENCNKKFKAILKCIEGRKGCGEVVEREWKQDKSDWKTHKEKHFKGKSIYGKSNYNNIKEFKIGHLEVLKAHIKQCHSIFHANEDNKGAYQAQMKFSAEIRKKALSLCTKHAMAAIQTQMEALQGRDKAGPQQVNAVRVWQKMLPSINE